MRWNAYLLLPLALTGCLASQGSAPAPRFSPEQQAFYDYFVSEGVGKDKALIYALNPSVRQLYFDDKKCLSYGAAPGSDAYVACRAQLEAAHR